MPTLKSRKRPSGRAWAQERAKRKGGSNIRGSREPWERSRVKGHYRNGRWVKPYLRYKGKRR